MTERDIAPSGTPAKDSPDAPAAPGSLPSPRRKQQQHQQKLAAKPRFKSLTALGARDSHESLQRIRRCRTAAAARKRSHLLRKRLDKPNVSELDVRRAGARARLLAGGVNSPCARRLAAVAG